MTSENAPRSKRLAVIPARGGSKRLPRKNIVPLFGKPLVQWAIEQAEQSGLFDRIVVSTEDPEIADVARRLGPYVPFLRSDNLADDTTDVGSVILNVVRELEARGEIYDTVGILLATSPLRIAADIIEAYKMFDACQEPNLMSVTPFEHCPFWVQVLNANGRLEPYFPELYETKRQHLPEAYRPNGAIHIIDIAWLKTAPSYTAQPMIGYVMPRERSIDIDNMQDLIEAEFLISRTRGAPPSDGDYADPN